jgi:hypothetical protein
MTAFAPPSQLAPVVPSMRKGFPPAQYALAMISPALQAACTESLTTRKAAPGPGEPDGPAGP